MECGACRIRESTSFAAGTTPLGPVRVVSVRSLVRPLAHSYGLSYCSPRTPQHTPTASPTEVMTGAHCGGPRAEQRLLWSAEQRDGGRWSLRARPTPGHAFTGSRPYDMVISPSGPGARWQPYTMGIPQPRHPELSNPFALSHSRIAFGSSCVKRIHFTMVHAWPSFGWLA